MLFQLCHLRFPPFGTTGGAGERGGGVCIVRTGRPHGRPAKKSTAGSHYGDKVGWYGWRFRSKGSESVDPLPLLIPFPPEDPEESSLGSFSSLMNNQSCTTLRTRRSATKAGTGAASINACISVTCKHEGGWGAGRAQGLPGPTCSIIDRACSGGWSRAPIDTIDLSPMVQSVLPSMPKVAQKMLLFPYPHLLGLSHFSGHLLIVFPVFLLPSSDCPTLQADCCSCETFSTLQQNK